MFYMDVILFDQKTLRVKGKNSSIVINPTTSTSKTEGDAVLVLENYDNISIKRIDGARITITGPGEYEVGGAKISTIKVEEKLTAKIDIDGVKLLVGNGEVLEKIQDKIDESDILVINANLEFNHSSITSFEPKVVLIYGEKKEDVAKSLGKESPEKVTKFSTTAEKLPTEMQIFLLG